MNKEKRWRNAVGITLKEKATLNWWRGVTDRPEDQLRAYYHAHVLRKRCDGIDAKDIKMEDELRLLKDSFTGPLLLLG